ncbi:MAG: retroviral-like aspartic protease family protein [Cyanobacteriota bacterium]|nr:retroviral-like aspartic protease family protein [Cyanobacteriota bacterium]
MLEPLFPRTALTFLCSALTIAGVACSKQSKTVKIPQNLKQQSVPSAPPVVDSPAAIPVQETSTQEPLSNQTDEEAIQPTSFEMGLDKASGGFSISQSAQSSDDWKLVADYYQDAINLMKSVSSQSRYYSIAKVKIKEYQQRFDYALEKSVAFLEPKPEPEPQRTVVTVPPLKESIARSQKMQVPTAVQKILQQNLQSPIAAVPQQLPTTVKQVEPPPQTPVKPRQPVPIPVQTREVYAAVPIQEQKPQVMAFRAPIKRRIGGTPIIDVTFNGKQRFEMIVDTGASGTVITQQMARLLGVIAVGKAKANTASAQSVEFPIGYVDSMEAGGVKIKKVPVAIAGSELQNGLLGHDFFGNYDITIKSDVVEFRPRSNSQIPQQKYQKQTRKSIPIYPTKLFKD